MITKAGSSGIDSEGAAYDHAFTIEIGRVSYTLNEDDTYEVTLNLNSSEGHEEVAPEVRTMSYDDLNNWFLNPTPEYYNTTIKNS